MKPSCLHRRPGLSVGDIHVWAARLVADEFATADLSRILDQEEQARAARFSFERDRVRFIMAHGVVRRILADYCDADAAALRFARNEHGKPYLLARASGPDLQFNISHSGNCCLLALRLAHPIGVDVEEVRDLPQAASIAKNYFSHAESSALTGLPETARRDAFFALWTQKEAMVKGFGIGLATNLARVEFDLDPFGIPQLAAFDGDRSIAQKWSIQRLDPAPGFIAAVATVQPIRSLALQNWSRAAD
jgi:4'-phosphopantetheinyl transferase